MKLGTLKPAKGATKNRKRIGRGTGSGHGGTSTRGHKGQGARTGSTTRPWFEGGQMPLQRRLPKRGFTNVHAKPVEIVNVGDLAGLGGEPITAMVLKLRGLINDTKAPLKILGNGELTEAVTVRAHAFSAGAKQKIEAAGGKVDVIVVPRRPKRFKKRNEKPATK
jgi:large subunit ribosomal protein L15